MMAIPLMLMAATAAVTVIGQQKAAKAEQQAANFQAQQLEEQGGQIRASAQRQGFEQRRQARLAMSRVQNLTGGNSTDESILNFTGNLAAEGEYNALTSLYEGEEAALGRQSQATGLRMQGKAARTAANYKSASTVLSTASSMFGAYSNGGFGATAGGRAA